MGEDSNLRRRSQQIYSLSPLTAREPIHGFFWSHLPGSNRRQSAYKAGALPTELRWRLLDFSKHFWRRGRDSNPRDELPRLLDFESSAFDHSSHLSKVRSILPQFFHFSTFYLPHIFFLNRIEVGKFRRGEEGLVIRD